MDNIQLILGIALLVMAVFLVIAVLMQSGSSKKLSGSIAGGAETFFGKNKGKTLDKMFSKLTNVVSVIFVLVVLVTYYYTAPAAADESANSSSADVTSTDASVADTDDESEASVADTSESSAADDSSKTESDASVADASLESASEDNAVSAETSTPAEDPSAGDAQSQTNSTDE